MSTPPASVVLRRIADEAVLPYQPQQLSQDGTGLQQFYQVQSAEDRLAHSVASTCAHSFASALRAVAAEFERCEAEDAAAVGALTARVEAAQAALADWRPETPVDQ